MSVYYGIGGRTMGRFRSKAKQRDVGFYISPPVVRMLVVGGLGMLLALGVMYSRGERPDVRIGLKGTTISQPGNEPRDAEVYVKNVPSDRILIPLAVADAPRNQAPDRRTTQTAGYYLERLRVQGDSEGEFVFVRRACVPPNMPEVCYLPQEQRLNRLVDRE
jgi:hypothetical protein